MASIDFTYPKVLNALGPTTKVKGRTESHAFLVWFLMHFMRLDDTDAQDAVCDGSDDKGVDGIYVDPNLEAVYVFQCKLVQNENRTLGDTQLKEFIGTLSQFASLESIAAIRASTSNLELSNLSEVIENDEAGRLLLAFDLKQPWACHQSYKILDELHTDIFARPEVNSHRVVAMVDLLGAITSASSNIKNQLIGSYRLTRYVLMYLLREALETDDQGRKLCREPSVFLLVPNGRERLRKAIEPVLGDLVIDLNAELRDREEAGNPFDYKREFIAQGN